MKYLYKAPESRMVRVIIDADAACECDDQYAIAHAVMSAKLDVRGMTAEHFDVRKPEGEELCYHEMKKILRLMGREEIPVYRGAAFPLKDESTPVDSDAAEFIISEAERDNSRPLFILCQGAVTNVASALIRRPDLGSRMTIIWIGGGNYPHGTFEFNMNNDINAANVLFHSEADIWIVPVEVYSTMQTGLEELYLRVSRCGEIGKYLFENTLEGNHRLQNIVPPPIVPEDYLGFPNGGSWCFGDSCAVGILLSNYAGSYSMVTAPEVGPGCSFTIHESGKQIRYYRNINSRFIFEDFFSKMEVYYGQ